MDREGDHQSWRFCLYNYLLLKEVIMFALESNMND